ncbi:helix-turn-helix protein [Thermosporothrix hazakensis]|jgi:transcriptional regulator with XRE-family HTH domain|uniref:Helix-turn-helix protein n=2 Tax=Thermosporothrix TaxID=768650 RepID=A0A326TWN8_THEHA|nr:helix-turn-helix transcriptional regulator [Thermosporothrix hazakensis]PZW20722.1 helix-turn-helix protein [Thermosporothrix hazakensis]BBH91733.1 hypothetical protein KTC_64840 [Thermosporothrix sp. COM3]GCE49850.1 hypothetical protein KTH_47190 [Thermosporothrix hazakensis]
MLTGKHLRFYRVVHGLTQKQLAERVGMGRNTIMTIETQNRVIRNIEQLMALQKALHIPYEEIGFMPVEKKQSH